MEDIRKEQQFLQKLQELVREAKKNRNTVSEEQIQEAFAELELSGEQMEQVRAYLAAAKIGIGEELPLEEYLTEEEHNYLEDYMEALAGIERPGESVLDALKLSAMAGERDAQQRLVEALLPDIVDIAKLYAGQDVLIEDLIGAGNEALARGVSMLGPLEGPQEVEGTLARMAMDAMEDLIAENLDEKAKEREVEDRVNAVADKARELAQDLRRKVTVEELAGEGELSPEQILEAIRLSGNKIEDLEG
ncbi:MAG: sigma-70 domain-containing protein [Eubacteriales bacterium]|nr:sigma-70 domain-containing protein [Eubacteriales bacterium]